MPLIRIDAWFQRLSQTLNKDRADSKDEQRYAARKITQHFYAEKPTFELVEKYSNVIAELLLSLPTSIQHDEVDFLSQILSIIKDILECDKKTRRPLVKELLKNDACSFLLHIIRSVSDDRYFGPDISITIHYILSTIGRHDKRLALKARLFKTIGCTIALLRVYCYNMKICPILLSLLKIYSKNATTAATICRSGGLQPLLRLALTLDRRYIKLQKMAITVVRILTQTKRVAARVTSTTIVRDILAVVFLMDKGQSRIRTIKTKECLLKVMFNLVKSKNGRLQFLEANGFYLLYELTMNVLTNDNYCTFLDLACQVMLRCCPKQNLPIESTFSPIKYQLPPGFEYIVFNEMLIADPKVMKDLDDMRGKCKSALSSNEQQQQQQKFRPKSSMTLSTPATPPVKSLRPKSSKGRLKQDEVIKIPEDDLNDMDEDDEFCESDDDEQSDDENKNNDEDSGDDEEREQKEDLSELKETLSSSTLNNNDTNRRDPDELAMCYEQFFDEMVDPISKLRTKMAQPIIDSRTNILLLNLIQTNQMEELPREVHQDYVLRSSNHQQIPIIEDELTQKYFLTYSLLAKMTKSAYRFTKIAHPDCYGAQSNPKCEIMQKLDVKGTKTSLLGDIRRILYSPTIINRTVYDLDALLVNSSNTQMSQTNILQNDDKRQCQMPRTSDHLHFDSQFECGNLRKAIQITDDEYDLILRPDINTFHNHQWFYFEVSNMRKDATYRFNIINFEKSNSQFNSGMQPVMYSVREALENRPYWKRVGDRISYYKNTYGKKKKICYTLTMLIKFQYENDVCYIAYHYPYTYTTLMTNLVNWSNTFDRSKVYFRQQTLCKTLSGNDCPILTITNLYNATNNGNDKQQQIPIHERSYVILTSRVHPGESNASWIMKGITDYLLSDEVTARQLRDRFVFKIIPMLNPDGVINGCHRCSLATKDLNRQWVSPNATLFPTIYHAKGIIAYLNACCSRPISLFCDFHGHSRQKNFFFYGNDPRQHYSGPAVGRSTLPKLFPKLFQGTPGFSHSNCMFTMRKTKEGCARIVMWDEFKIDLSYTMETTYNGFDQGIYKGLQIQTSTLQLIGRDFCTVLWKLSEQEMKPFDVTPIDDLFFLSECFIQDTSTPPTKSKRSSNGLHTNSQKSSTLTTCSKSSSRSSSRSSSSSSLDSINES